MFISCDDELRVTVSYVKLGLKCSFEKTYMYVFDVSYCSKYVRLWAGLEWMIKFDTLVMKPKIVD